MMLSNHEMAKRYKEKSKLIGKDILDIKLLENDRVELVEVLDKEDTGRLVIPSFITDISDYIPLYDCKYTEVYIDNKIGVWLNISALCAGMDSIELKLGIRYPEYITDMSYLFRKCTELAKVDLGGMDIRNVKDIKNMFEDCIRLNDIDISGLNISNVIDMSDIFNGCISLKGVKLSGLDTSKVEDMSKMFIWCERLRKLDLCSFKTPMVKDMAQMFRECYRLKSVDISGSILKKDVNTVRMFEHCIVLNDIKACDSKILQAYRLKDIEFLAI